MALHKTPTPETDANLAAWIYYDLYHCIESLMLGGSLSDDPLPWPDFACKLERERDEAREYADRLAEGLPDGMLPKDVEVLREANLGLATDIAAVTAQRDRLVEALEIAANRFRYPEFECNWENVSKDIESALQSLTPKP